MKVKDQQIVDAAIAFIVARLAKTEARKHRSDLMSKPDYCEGDVVADSCHIAKLHDELSSVSQFCNPCIEIHDACISYQKASAAAAGRLRSLTGLVQRRLRAS